MQVYTHEKIHVTSASVLFGTHQAKAGIEPGTQRSQASRLAPLGHRLLMCDLGNICAVIEAP